jgi:hypothetical protein
MQTLNVGAGRTDQEYKEAEEQRRADLLADSRSDANYFFWAAGLAAIGTGLLPVRLNILVSIGLFDLLGLNGRPLDSLFALVMYGAAAAWVVTVLALGFVARGGHRWAFLAGMVLYGADMIALVTNVFIVGIRGPCLLCVQMVPRAKGAERCQTSGHRNLLKRTGAARLRPLGLRMSEERSNGDWLKTTTLAQGGHRFWVQALISPERCHLPL